MKPQTLPVKRRPAPKGIFKRLSAVTGNRKQRVAAAATSDMEIEDSSSKISRALTIIFLIHIVAIGLIFVHQRFLDGRVPDTAKTAKTGRAEAAVALAPAQPRANLPLLAAGEKGFMVSQGDNYSRVATKLGVEEDDLRAINKNADIIPGLRIKVPSKRIIAQDFPEVTSIREKSAAEPDLGMMENVDIANAPRAQVVKSKISYPSSQPAAASTTASGKSYVVQNGDSVWRIANKFKVNQDTLMKANGISDARKMKVGMSLVIP
ncbi:MAG: LysM peptidoglycan-binding domain-containing protein [Luteolibacter sp.]|uniref:LysM peptidoglycan-binding domain-containing protein n=1 Tax=Luteolibacter sp. TaxID=1962973 RepID=UPI003264BC10